ncbi:CLOCK-interacting pacemaker isoform 2-T2 [Glossophaga mutica]
MVGSDASGSSRKVDRVYSAHPVSPVLAQCPVHSGHLGAAGAFASSPVKHGEEKPTQRGPQETLGQTGQRHRGEKGGSSTGRGSRRVRQGLWIFRWEFGMSELGRADGLRRHAERLGLEPAGQAEAELQDGGRCLPHAVPHGRHEERAGQTGTQTDFQQGILGGGSSQLQSWTVQPSFEVISAQPPLLFLHPPVPPPARPCHAGEKKSDSRNYLPILNSYTKIAPHPGKRGLSLSPKERERGTQKKLRTDRPGSSSPAREPTKTGALSSSPPPAAPPSTKVAEDAALQGVPSLAAGGSPQTLQPVSGSHVAKAPSLTFASPASPVCASDSTPHGLESNSPLSPLPANYSSPLWAAEHLCRSPDVFAEQRQSKHRRFQNTLVVLHKSGLLEITLKTKELIRQNQATQVELDQLKEQTQLLLEAIKGRAPQAWAKLQASLASGSSHTGSDLDAFSDRPDM